MTKAIEAGMPKLRIEEAAARTQARIDRGEETIVGVNKFRSTTRPQIDVAEGRQQRGARAADRQARSGCAASATTQGVQAALDALTEAARTGNGNLLELAIEAARARATVGEISDALEKVFGRHRAEIRADLGRLRRRRSERRASDVERVQRDVDGVRRRTRAAGRASWSPRWARTATTAAPR